MASHSEPGLLERAVNESGFTKARQGPRLRRSAWLQAGMLLRRHWGVTGAWLSFPEAARSHTLPAGVVCDCYQSFARKVERPLLESSMFCLPRLLLELLIAAYSSREHRFDLPSHDAAEQAFEQKSRARPARIGSQHRKAGGADPSPCPPAKSKCDCRVGRTTVETSTSCAVIMRVRFDVHVRRLPWAAACRLDLEGSRGPTECAACLGNR